MLRTGLLARLLGEVATARAAITPSYMRRCLPVDVFRHRNLIGDADSKRIPRGDERLLI